tara:strand:+ start:799 stop:1515 length:717 start_codon:yes stop_codon:yes gene_type:complete
MSNYLEIIIPVFNEDQTILKSIETIFENLDLSFMITICYDFDEDTTLKAINNSSFKDSDKIRFVKNIKSGPHSAVMTGIYNSKANHVLVMPADDEHNAIIIKNMYKLAIEESYDIVCPSRFMVGGSMVGAPLVKKLLVITANYTLRKFARLPVDDATNGFRLFSRNVIDNINITSKHGFAYSIEYLVKSHRKGFKITQIPSNWRERKSGKSRFKVYSWFFYYLRWYVYALITRLKKFL